MIEAKSAAICGLAGVLLAAFAAVPARAETVKVGVILTYSGPNSEQGDQIEKGLDLYVKEHKKDLPPGVNVELIRRDDTGPNPAVAKRVAQELVTREHVQFLTGVVWSPNAGAIAPIATAAKVPFVDMNAASVSLTRASPYLVRVSFTLWQEAYPFGKWAAQHGTKRAYIAVSDYAPGHDAEAGFTKGFTEAGGEVVGTVRFPLKSPDFVPFMQRVRDAKPQAVFIFVPSGTQATAIMKALGAVGLRDKVKVLSTQDLVPEEELPNMGDLPLGIVTAGTYSTAAKRPANEAFLAAWKREYGTKAIPDFMSVGGWDGMAAIFDVIKQTKGKFTGDQAMEILSHWKNPNSPRGPISIDPETRDIVQNVYIRRTEKVNGHLANVEFDTIPNVKDPWKEFNPPKK